MDESTEMPRLPQTAPDTAASNDGVNPAIDLLHLYRRLNPGSVTKKPESSAAQEPEPETENSAQQKDSKDPAFSKSYQPEVARILEVQKATGDGVQRYQLDTFDDAANVHNPEEDDLSGYPIVMRREMTFYWKIIKLQLEIRSPRLRHIFMDEAQDHRDVNTESSPIIIPSPYHALFFLMDRLEDISNAKGTDEPTRKELNLLLNYARSWECLGPTLEKWQSLVPNNKVTFDILWTLFPPYEEVYTRRKEGEQCFLLEQCLPVQTAQGIQGRFKLIGAAHDGTDFGLERITIMVPAFHGVKQISPEDLEIIPLKKLGKDKDRIKKRLIARSRTYLKLQDAPFTYKEIMGPCKTHETIDEFSLHVVSKRLQKWSTNSNMRAVVDEEAFQDKYSYIEEHTFVANNIQELKSRKLHGGNHSADEIRKMMEVRGTDVALAWADADTELHSASQGKNSAGFPRNETTRNPNGTAPGTQSQDENHDDGTPPGKDSGGPSRKTRDGEERVRIEDIAEEDLLICSDVCHAFLLDKQVWVSVKAEDLGDVEFYPNTWNTLQLEAEKKQVIRAMVDGFLRDSDSYKSLLGWERVVIKKGNGLLFLFHGGPGLGKTYTAEAISEETRRPLYRITTGELGTKAEEFERRLASVFKLGYRWGAIVLLDEADIVMARRDQNSLDRNALVGVFLRLMEYYEGLLFLTTNRFSDVDPAFRNRIHGSIEYTPHDKTARRNIWRQILSDNLRVQARLQRDAKKQDSSGEKHQDPKTGISRASTSDLEPIPISDAACDILADLDCNGRDIRNIIRAAMSIANSEGKPMSPEHVVRVIRSLSAAKNKGQVLARLQGLTVWDSKT